MKLTIIALAAAAAFTTGTSTASDDVTIERHFNSHGQPFSVAVRAPERTTTVGVYSHQRGLGRTATEQRTLKVEHRFTPHGQTFLVPVRAVE